jgi:hypothetical protein
MCPACGAVAPRGQFCARCGAATVPASDEAEQTVRRSEAPRPTFETPVVLAPPSPAVNRSRAPRTPRSTEVTPLLAVLIGALVAGALLVAALVVVLVRRGGDDSATASTDSSRADVTAPAEIDLGTTVATLAVTVAPDTTLTTAPASTTGPVTTLALATTTRPGPLPEDLGIAGRPMSSPACDGRFVTLVAAVVTSDRAVAASKLRGLLVQHPGSQYLLTRQSCNAFRPNVNGQDIWQLYFGPFDTVAAACAKREFNSDDYVKALVNLGSPVLEEKCL